MSDEKRKNRPASYEEAPPTRWVPIKRADPVPPPPAPAPELRAAPRATPPPPEPVDPRTPFAAHRESQSGMMRLARHQGESRVVAVAVVAGAALLTLALAFALLRQ